MYPAVVLNQPLKYMVLSNVLDKLYTSKCPKYYHVFPFIYIGQYYNF